MPAAKPLPDAEYLRECLSYDPETGSLTWKTRPRKHFTTSRGWSVFNTRYPGKSAGVIQERDKGHFYVRVGIDQRLYNAHRIIWALVHGIDPDDLKVDHKDGNGTNNRLANLRIATLSQNNMNRKGQIPGQLKGVWFHKRRKKWVGELCPNGTKIYLGLFDTEIAAHAAYRQAADKHHGEFACLDR